MCSVIRGGGGKGVVNTVTLVGPQPGFNFVDEGDHRHNGVAHFLVGSATL